MVFDNSTAASSAHTFMTYSLLSLYIDFVHILPEHSISGEILNEYIKRIIIDLEEISIKVICVLTDNNSINRKVISFFSNPPKVQIAYMYIHSKMIGPIFCDRYCSYFEVYTQ